MKILVTGGAGFIGSHLVESLVEDGKNVRCLLKEGPAPEQIKEMGVPNEHLEKLGVEIAYGNLKDKDSLIEATKDVDLVYHLAAFARMYAQIPIDEFRLVNVDGTKNLLDACIKNGVKKVVYTSSLEAVGPSMDGKPKTEESECAPVGVYGETKLGGELLMREYYKKYGLKTVVIRPPMIFGPRNMLLHQRLFRPVSKGIYPVMGDGSTLMEFCYVKNQVQGIRLGGERNGTEGETFFISNERSYQIKEILSAMADEMGTKLKIIHTPIWAGNAVGLAFETLSKFLRFYPITVPETGRPVFSRRTVSWTSKSTWFCDISKAKKELEYKPKYTLREGLRETIEWYRNMKLLPEPKSG